MREWKRIIFSRVWLGMLALLVVCNVSLYVFDQPARLHVSLTDYNESNQYWSQLLAQLPPDQGVEMIQAQQNVANSWAMAEYLVQMEETYSLDQEYLQSCREEYPELDAQMVAIREGQHREEKAGESIVLEKWLHRLEYQLHYEGRLQEIKEQAERIGNNPLFSQPGSFQALNAEKTLRDFDGIQSAPYFIEPNDVIESFLANRSNMIFSLCLMMVTVVLLLEPRRFAMELVEQSCANGRCIYTLWRVGALLLAALISSALMIGSVLAAGMVVYGQPIALSAPVQVMEHFQNWTKNTSIGGVLVWITLFRTGGLWLTGLMLWALLRRFRSLPVGLVLTSGVLLLEFHWFTSFGVNDAGYPLASINLFHLLSAEHVAGRYLNYNVLGHPVNERIFLVMVMLFLMTLMIAMLLAFSHWSRGVRHGGKWSRWTEIIATKVRSKRKNHSLWNYEGRKLLIYSGGIVILLVGVLFLCMQQIPNQYLAQEEVLVVDYARLYDGPVSKQTMDAIEQKREEQWSLYRSLSEQNLNEDFTADLSGYQARCSALDRLAERYHRLLDMDASGMDHIELVDESPLERIYGFTGESLRIRDASAVLLVLCFLLPRLFAVDHRCGMRLSLLSSANGRDVLWSKKVGWAFLITTLLWAVWIGRDLALLGKAGIRWSAFASSAQSIIYWDDALGALPLGIYLIGFYLVRLVGLVSACALLLVISGRWSAMLTAGSMGAALMVLPQLLKAAGMDWMSALSWSKQLAGDGFTGDATHIVWLVVWIAIAVAGIVRSRKQWRRNPE